MMDLVPLLLQLVAGAVAGIAGGMILPRRSLGPRWNAALGAVGGVAGGSLLGGVLGAGLLPMSASAALAGLLLPTGLGLLRRRKVVTTP